jgi:hypothetical protein
VALRQKDEQKKVKKSRTYFFYLQMDDGGGPLVFIFEQQPSLHLEKQIFLGADDVDVDVTRVARLFLVQHTKKGKIVPKRGKMYQMAIKYTKWP